MPADESQPKPELFLDLIRRQQRGRLKIYLGFAAGVGKTYDMLLEEIGCGGRASTWSSALSKRTAAPKPSPRSTSWNKCRGGGWSIAASCWRKWTWMRCSPAGPPSPWWTSWPHTNAPGSRNAKRYQDVEEILRAGINVVTTLNIQHLESLHDIVERATGVRVKERLPDYVVTMADQIVNVDLSAGRPAGKAPGGKDLSGGANPHGDGELLRAGETHAAPRAGHGRDRLPARPVPARGGAAARRRARFGSERVMVCLSSRSPARTALLRKAARIADRLGAPWYAVYVQTPRESPRIRRCRHAAPNRQQPRPGPGAGRNVAGLQRRRSDQHHRGLRQGIWDYPHCPGPHAAAVASPLVRPVRAGSPGAKGSRR